jgi:heme iron utilization protein
MQNLSPAQLNQLYQDFPAQFKSVILGTVNATGDPEASYAPFVIDAERSIYIFVSGLSAHTQNLSNTGKASVLFIQDEAETPQVFARKRLTYRCTASLLERESEPWVEIAQQFESRFGNIIEMMKGLPDFQIFKLCPQSGRLVAGFGSAYDTDPNDLNQLVHQVGQ